MKTRFLALAALVLASCAGAQDPVRFEGIPERVGPHPAEVPEVPDVPEGFYVVGEVSAECTRLDGLFRIEHAKLTEIDCDEDLLGAALRERASDVGGELLASRKCESSTDQRGFGTETDIRCTGLVARATARERGRQSLGPAPVEPPREASAREAWRVVVAILPAPGAPARAPRDRDHVGERPMMPVSHVEVGSIRAKCRDCSRVSAERAVLAVAGRAGASDVVGLRCVRFDRRWECIGTAAAPEVETDPTSALR